MKNYFLSNVLLLISIFCVITNISSQVKQPSGSGSYGSPYLITSMDDLYWVTEHPGTWSSYFKQTEDIYDTASSPYGILGFQPIGYYESLISYHAFSGEYDGGGHTISGLSIHRANDNGIGLFGFTKGATIKNLGIIYARVYGDTYVGGIIGICGSYTKISNCYYLGNSSGKEYIGGIVGLCDFSEIKCCSNVGTIKGSTYIGGIVGGCTESSIIENCYNRGYISSGEMGGHTAVGGIAGSSTDSSTINNCYNAGFLQSAGSTVGGIVGYNVDHSRIYNSFWDTHTSGITSSKTGIDKTSEEMKMESTYTDAGWDFTNVWVINSGLNDGYPYLFWEFLTTGINDELNTIPSKYALLQNFPNPFNPTTTIKYKIPRGEYVLIKAYDVSGREITTLVNEYKLAGEYSLEFDGSNLSSGIYFYKMQTSSFVDMKKFILLK